MVSPLNSLDVSRLFRRGAIGGSLLQCNRPETPSSPSRRSDSTSLDRGRYNMLKHKVGQKPRTKSTNAHHFTNHITPKKSPKHPKKGKNQHHQHKKPTERPSTTTNKRIFEIHSPSRNSSNATLPGANFLETSRLQRLSEAQLNQASPFWHRVSCGMGGDVVK